MDVEQWNFQTIPLTETLIKKSDYLFNGQILCQVNKVRDKKYYFEVLNGAWEGILDTGNMTMVIDPCGWEDIKTVNIEDWYKVYPKNWDRDDQEAWYFRFRRN